jgi:hypothetical protein
MDLIILIYMYIDKYYIYFLKLVLKISFCEKTFLILVILIISYFI